MKIQSLFVLTAMVSATSANKRKRVFKIYSREEIQAEEQSKRSLQLTGFFQNLLGGGSDESSTMCAFCPGKEVDGSIDLNFQGQTCGTVSMAVSMLGADDTNCALAKQAESICCPDVTPTAATEPAATTTAAAVDTTTTTAEVAAVSTQTSLMSMPMTLSPSKSPVVATLAPMTLSPSESPVVATLAPTAMSMMTKCAFCHGVVMPDPDFALPNDQTCGSIKTIADDMAVTNKWCETLKGAEEYCCPPIVETATTTVATEATTTTTEAATTTVSVISPPPTPTATEFTPPAQGAVEEPSGSIIIETTLAAVAIASVMLLV